MCFETNNRFQNSICAALKAASLLAASALVDMLGEVLLFPCIEMLADWLALSSSLISEQ